MFKMSETREAINLLYFYYCKSYPLHFALLKICVDIVELNLLKSVSLLLVQI